MSKKPTEMTFDEVYAHLNKMLEEAGYMAMIGHADAEVVELKKRGR